MTSAATRPSILVRLPSTTCQTGGRSSATISRRSMWIEAVDAGRPGKPIRDLPGLSRRGQATSAIRGAALMLATAGLAALMLTAGLAVALTHAGLALRLLRLVVGKLDGLARLFVVLPLLPLRLRPRLGHLRLIEVLVRSHRYVAPFAVAETAHDRTRNEQATYQ